MSAIAVPDPADTRFPADSPASARPGLARLTRVELRKMTDTRAGFWLLATTALLSVAAVATVAIAGKAPDQKLGEMFSVALAPQSILLPIVGILLVTSEWTQRTTLITFALVPQRERVLAAKLLAGCALALAGFAVALGVGALGTLVTSPDVSGAWSLSPAQLGQTLLSVVTGMMTGIGFGAVLLVSAPAIVLYFALPIAFGALGAIPALNGVAEWVDIYRAAAPLTEELLSAGQWARAATALLIWTTLPLAGGLWRILRDEVR